MNDSYGNEICRNIIKIPKSVRKYVLQKYMNQVYILSSISFFQWRKMNPSKYYEPENDLDE